MLSKKFYIPVGAVILAICAVGFFALRSDVPSEPVKIYKITTPAEKAEQTDTATRDTANNSKSTQGGHFHADGTWHEGLHETPVAETTQASNKGMPWEIAKLKMTPEQRREFEEKNADILARHEAWKSEQARKSAQVAADNQAILEYHKSNMAWHRKFQALLEESELLSAESDRLNKAADIALRNKNREKALEIREALLDLIERRAELRDRYKALESEKPIYPSEAMQRYNSRQSGQ